MRRLAPKWVVAAIVLISAVTSSLGDIRIKRRMTINNRPFETTIYIKGARQRNETRYQSPVKGKYFEVAFVEQCDLKQLLWVDLTNRRYAIQTGIPVAAVTAFNELQVSGDPQRAHAASVRARKKGLLTGTTTVVDTGDRREMFGYVARHLKTTTVWSASPNTCDDPGLTSQTDGWYVDLFYGLDCSADLSGSISQTHTVGSGKCFSEYAVKKGYWIEHKRIGPASLGYPLVEIRTSYDDKGKALVVNEEVLELSTTALDAALFDVPVDFTKVNFKTDNSSFFRRLFSFIGR